MNFHVMTLFPEMIMGAMSESITGRALSKGTISLEAINIRDFSKDKHKHVDDYPYGGGAGMVMQPGPIYDCYCQVLENIEDRISREELSLNAQPDENLQAGQEQDLEQPQAEQDQDLVQPQAGQDQDLVQPQAGQEQVSVQPQSDYNSVQEEEDQVPGSGPENKKVRSKPRVIYTTPQGRVFSQEIARDLAKEDDLIFLCGHYEGVDERILEEIVTDNISIGDYVLTGGELPAMVMMDAISRLVPGVLNNEVSASDESFENGLLEYPQYTRPEVFHERKVPDVLLSGHHANIDKWRKERSIERTFERRPDLLEKLFAENKLTEQEVMYISKLLD